MEGAIYELYLLTFKSGRCYVGISKNGALSRYKKHQISANNGSEVICHKAWRKYGPPDVRVLALADKAYIFDLESRAIESYRTLFPHGYNMTHGGEIGPTCSPVVARKISATKKGKPLHPNTRSACIAKNTGFKHTEETKAKLSAMRMGHPCSEETRRKLSVSLKGKQNSPESIRRMAESLRGRKQTPETIAKRIASRIGIKNSPESYAKGWIMRKSKQAIKEN